MAKYNNRKTVIDGIQFDSKKEAEYYVKLKTLESAGEIDDIQLQVPFVLQPSFKAAQYGGRKTERAITYIADFVVRYADGHVEVVDVKGIKTDVYMLKRKMLLKVWADNGVTNTVFKEV